MPSSTSSSSSASPFSSLQRVGLTLLGLVLAVFGLVFMVGALVAGGVVAAVWLLWSMVRGRKVTGMRFSWPPPTFGGMGRRGPSPSSSGEIVDVQVREVVDDAASARDHRTRHGHTAD